ncbi:MAG: SIS domain-containing protein [Patescibacteria group bacterium]
MINFLPDQCQSAWQVSSNLKFPDSYSAVKNIVICAMGGSRFTPLTVKYLFPDKITLPYEIIDDYDLPAYVNENTLVILSSYSGATEEVLSCRDQALVKKAQITQVSSQSMLAVPGYIFNPDKFNPSRQPRMGNGFLLFGHLGLLQALKLIDLKETEVQSAIDFLRHNLPQFQTQAEALARDLKDTHLFIITSGFLRGFGNGFANQINENSKMISDHREIPELNHHLMEGLKFPNSLRQNAVFLFINSALYSPKIQLRFKITQEIVTKQGIKTLNLNLAGPDKLSQVLEAYALSGFLTLKLAEIYQVDPLAIPWVDYFKKELGKQPAGSNPVG